VDQENPTSFEPNNQILPSPLERSDSLSLELGRDFARVVRTGQTRVRDLDTIEGSTDQVGLEPCPDRFDLWQLGHAASVAPGLPG
jgi:hypothetical protein